MDKRAEELLERAKRRGRRVIHREPIQTLKPDDVIMKLDREVELRNGEPVPWAHDADIISRIAESLARIADHFDPPPPNVVGTPYVARKLACTTVWVTEMIRSGELPKRCIVPGTGNGRPWKLYRRQIDSWLESR